MNNENVLSVLEQEVKTQHQLDAMLPNPMSCLLALLINTRYNRRQQQQLSLCAAADRDFRQLTRVSLLKKYDQQVYNQLTRQLHVAGQNFYDEFGEQTLSLNLSRFESDNKYQARIGVPIEFSRQIIISGGLSYWVTFRINLPRLLGKNYCGNGRLSLPLHWNKADRIPLKQVNNWYGNVSIIVNSGFDSTSRYYWDKSSGPVDYYLKHKIINELAAYNEYKHEFEQQPWYVRLFKSCLSLEEWRVANKPTFVDLTKNVDRINDPRVMHALSYSSGFQEDLLKTVDEMGVIEDWQNWFNFVWHEELHYPAIKFHRCHLVIKK